MKAYKLLQSSAFTALAYIAAGMAGQMMAIPPGYATIIWPASGIALAATLVWGKHALPGVFLGSFCVNAYISSGSEGALLQLLLPMLIGLGAALQAGVGATLVNRVLGFPFRFQHPASVFRFLVLGGPIASLVNATISCILLWQMHVITTDQFLRNWLSWWAGDTIGVIVVIPWLLVSVPGLANVRLPRRRLLAGALLTIACVTGVLALATSRIEQQKQQDEFFSNADLLAHSLRTSIRASVDLLHGLSGFVRNNSELTPETFKAYTQPILQRAPGLYGLSWNISLPGKDLASFQHQMQQLYSESGFEITERSTDGSLVPIQTRDRHVVVGFIEPVTINQSALGYDIYSQQTRKEALDKASALQREIATAPIQLAQQPEPQTGVQIFLPVFDSPSEPGHSSLLGYTAALLHIAELANIAFAEGILSNTRLALMAPDSESQLSVLYSVGLSKDERLTVQDKIARQAFPLLRENLIDVGGQQWRLVQFNNSPFVHQPWGIHLLLACGLLVSGLLSWFLIIIVGHTYDVERQVEQRTEDLSATNSLLEVSQQIARMGSWDWHPQTNQSKWSNELYRLLGYEDSQQPSLDNFLAVVHDADKEQVLHGLNEWQNNHGRTGKLQCRISPTNADPLILELHCKPQAQTGMLSIVARDITESHQQQERLRLAAVTFESQDAILITNAQLKIQRINRGFANLTGFSNHQLSGCSLQTLAPINHPDDFFKHLAVQDKNVPFTGDEVWTRKNDGSEFLARVSVSSVTDYHGAPEHYVLGFLDITAQKASEAKIHNLAFFDPLTQLPNRAHLFQQLEVSLQQAKHKARRFAVMFLDLDGFKDVNDSMGHEVGDHLLCTIAGKLQHALRPGDFAARLGGDEFCVLTEELTDTEAANVADRLIAAINDTVLLEGTEYLPRTSIGIALFPDHGDSPQALIKAADTAMYLAKNSGKNQYSFYRHELTERAVEQFQFESELRAAVYAGELELYFQPQFSLRSRQLVGAEALIRWPHKERGLLYPDRFLPVADRLKLSYNIDLWVLDVAVKQATEWRRLCQTSMRVAVNITSSTFTNPNFVQAVKATLQRYRLPASALEIEITDAVSVRSDIGKDNARQLQQAGISLAIDNFGSVGSSLIDLTEIKFDTIKIDRSFISTLTQQPESAVLLGSLIGSSHGLGANIIAQGVESLDQVQILHGLSCDIAQGYYFCRPVEAGDVVLNQVPSLICEPTE